MPALLDLSAVRNGISVVALATAAACAPMSSQQDTSIAMPPTPAGAPHDFDFEQGRWHTSLRRLMQPLSGSVDWAEYEGTSVVRPVLAGRANLVELEVAGPRGRIEGVSLRLFDTHRRRWTLNYANLAGGTMELPMSGGFGGAAHGVFYSGETFKGRPILVRFVVDVLDADHCRFEQAFSADAGVTWEVNWIALDTRLPA
jgi:hypothetical protein